MGGAVSDRRTEVVQYGLEVDTSATSATSKAGVGVLGVALGGMGLGVCAGVRATDSRVIGDGIRRSVFVLGRGRSVTVWGGGVLLMSKSVYCGGILAARRRAARIS